MTGLTISATARAASGPLDFAILGEDWVEQAICAQVDPEIFFPEKGGSTKDPKKVCGRCPVRQECLTYALDHDERFGIWGGVSERERRKLKRADLLALNTETVQEISMTSTTELPDYVQEIAELLADTEGHPEPFVRELRKIVIQASLALRTAHTTASGSDATATAQLPPATGSTSPSEPEPAKKKRAPSEAQQLLNQYGVTFAHVRAWAKDHSMGVPDRGGIPLDIVKAYIEHYTSTAA